MGQLTKPAQAAARGAHRACERPVDLVHLARHTFGDRDLERQILQLFLVQSDAYLARLRRAGDTGEWRAAVHTIKGSARGIGAWRVARDAERLETMAMPCEADARDRAVAALETELDATNAFIRELFAEP